MKRTDGVCLHDVLCYVFALCLVIPAVASAQQPPSTIDPGRLRERFDFQPEAAPAPPPTQVRSESAEPLPDSLKSIRVTLKEVRIESATVLPGNVLQARADSYTGREITGGDILELASSLTAMLPQRGLHSFAGRGAAAIARGRHADLACHRGL